MPDSALSRTVLAVIFLILIISLIRCSTSRKNIRTVSCDNRSELILTVEKEFVELSYQNVYNLMYKKNTDKTPRMVTGNLSVLPEAKRYRDMIIVKDLRPGKSKSVFDIHYLFPSVFTREEFEQICECYERNRGSFPEIEKKIGLLVYGDYISFREVFRLPDGSFIVTEYNGNLTMVKDPSREAMTIPAELKNFTHIGYFDDSGRLHIRRGRIVSGVFKGLFGRPVKQVQYVTENGEVDYTGEVDITWCDMLYREDKTWVNIDYILSAVNDRGERIDQVFTYKDYHSQK